MFYQLILYSKTCLIWPLNRAIQDRWSLNTALINMKCTVKWNQRFPGACNRSPGSITMQLHCGGHVGGRARLPDTILEEDHPMTSPSKFGSNWATGSRQDGLYAGFSKWAGTRYFYPPDIVYSTGRNYWTPQN